MSLPIVALWRWETSQRTDSAAGCAMGPKRTVSYATVPTCTHGHSHLCHGPVEVEVEGLRVPSSNRQPCQIHFNRLLQNGEACSCFTAALQCTTEIL